MKKIIIAIDGYSSSGKSTMAKRLAAEIGYSYIDSGAMYRAVTLYAMRHGMIDADGKVDENRLVAALPDIHISFAPDPATGKTHTFLGVTDVENEIRSLAVSEHVSPVAVIPAVRRDLVRKQQAFATDKGIVMDGRDIGTTVFPDAELKIFVNASPEVRAQRRYKELCNKGQSPDYDEVLRNITERDYIDSHRAESPLRRADDAIDLDNDGMTLQEQDKWLMDRFKEAVSR